MSTHEESVVLKTEPSGESFLKLHLLTAESGVFFCMKRAAKKANTTTTPDLFDHASVLLETSQQGTMRFVKEYQLLKRREAIGQSYATLRCASELAQLLVLNASHMPESEILFNLATRAFDTFAERKIPEIVLLKSLYLLLKDEGYPVRESWWPTLRTDLQATAQSVLKNPTPQQIDPKTKEACIAIERHLWHWMRAKTDLILLG